MFEVQRTPIRIRSESPQAYAFWRDRYKPRMDTIKRRLQQDPACHLKVGIWVPRLKGAARFQLHEIESDLSRLNADVEMWIGANTPAPDAEENLAALSRLCDERDVVFGVLLGKAFPLERFLDISADISSKFFIFLNEAIQTAHGARLGRKDFEFRQVYWRSMIIRYPEDFSDRRRRFYGIFIRAADALKRARYMQTLLDDTQKPLKASQNLFTFYLENKFQIDISQESSHNYFLAFVRHLSNPNREELNHHLSIMDHPDYLETKAEKTSDVPGRAEESDGAEDSGREEGSGGGKAAADGQSDAAGETDGSDASDRRKADEDRRKERQNALLTELIDCFLHPKSGRPFIEWHEDQRLCLTYSGKKYFKLMDMAGLPILPDEMTRFRERWRRPLEQTYRTYFELFNNSESLSKAADELYKSHAKKLWVERKARYLANKFFFTWMTREEEAFWNHPWSKQLFDIWRENIGGLRKLWRTGDRDRIRFFEYMLGKLAIAHHPRHSGLFSDFKNQAFNTTMLRPNSHAHFYMIFSFEMRTIKSMISQYFDLAAITGQYDLLFRRYKPYHTMLKLNAKPGERTSFDMRHFVDWKPLTYRMDCKYTIPVPMENARTRQRDRFISIPIKKDPVREAEKKSEIEEMKDLQKNIAFPHGGYLTGNDFGTDGKIYYTAEGKWEPIENFMGKRQNFIQLQDELTLLKTIPRPGTDSGLIVNFNLLDPIAVLINGINRRRDFEIDEIRYLIRCVDLLAREKGSEPKLDDIIESVFTRSETNQHSEQTEDLLRQLHRIERESETEDDVWDFLISRFIHGAYHPLLQAICHRLTAEGFEVLFSLFPLMKGRELRLDEATGRLLEEGIDRFNENQLPLVESLKRELGDLLKNIFTSHLDISGATKRIQSEARLARMVVAYCLNVRSDPEKFERKLRDHLNEHYQTHLDFLKEHIGESDLFKRIHKIGVDISGVIEEDVAEIMELIQRTRGRLYSRANNNRLLCFIDPKSVDVQIGEFQYSGKPIESEMEYLTTREDKKRELSRQKEIHDAEVREVEMEKDKTVSKGRLEKEKTEAKLNKERLIYEAVLKTRQAKAAAQEEAEAILAEFHEKIFVHRSRQQAAGIIYKAKEALRHNDLKTFYILSLLETHSAEGMAGVEKLLADSPNILLTIAPEVYEAHNVHQLKQGVLNNLDKVLDKLDPITVTTLFSKDYGELIKSDMYKSVSTVLADALKNLGWRHRPMLEQVFGKGRMDTNGGKGNGGGDSKN